MSSSKSTGGNLPQHMHPANTSTTMCPACLKDGSRFTQRAQRGFADEDVWSFCDYLAGVLAGGLAILRDNLHGCPPELCSEDDQTWADDGVKRWRAILDEMIVGFSQEDQLNMTPELRRSLELLAYWWGHLWD